MGHVPVRNHLDIPYGLKLGDRMDPTTARMVWEMRRILDEYRIGLQTGVMALREIDTYVALIAQSDTILPGTHLPWENSDVNQWLPGSGN